METSDRLKKAIAFLKGKEIIVKQQDIAEKMGVNKTNLSTALKGDKRYLTNNFLKKFCNTFPEINYDWLLTGKGSMFKEGGGGQPVILPEPTERSVPFWNLPVTAGRSLIEVIGKTEPDGYVVNLPGADIAENILPVIGMSMEPEITDGALIGVRKMHNYETLNTERIYLIITTDERMIKRIEHDAEDDTILWCVSPNYKRFKIYKSDIIEVHRVCFVYNPK